MTTLHLRRLSFIVDSPDPGDYFAVLQESKDDAAIVEDIWASEEPYATWREAWDVGAAKLLSMVPDQATGPLAPGEDENVSPVG